MAKKTHTKKKKKKKKKTNVYDTSSELYNDLPVTYCDEYHDISDAKRSKIDPKHDPLFNIWWI